MRALVRLAASLAALLLAGTVSAAVTCSVAVTSIVKGYDPNDIGDTVTTGSYTVSCTRLATDPNTFNWSLGANNGQNNAGAQNQVIRGTRTYDYELYRTTPYTNGNRWQDAVATRFTGTLDFGTQLMATQSGPFDLRLPGPQTVRAAGTYTDTVTVDDPKRRHRRDALAEHVRRLDHHHRELHAVDAAGRHQPRLHLVPAGRGQRRARHSA